MYHDIYPARLPEPFKSYRLLSKAGVRGFPGIDSAQALLLSCLQDPPLPLAEPILDLTAHAGLSALTLSATPLLVERSASAIQVLTAQHLQHLVAIPSQLEGQFATLLAVLPADKGNDTIEELLQAAYRLCAPQGVVYLAGDKDKGFDRYFKWAKQQFGEGEILERHKGYRVAAVVKNKPDPRPNHPATLSFSQYPFQNRGTTLQIASLAGVFSRKGIDLASQLLLEHLPTQLQGSQVLDIGAGAGVLGAWAAAQGAHVTLLEDDLGGVLSCQETLRLNGLNGTVLHSDVGSALPPEARFDLVLSNPPFHVGSDLILDIAEAFIALAAQHLKRGGDFYLVANQFLPYEGLLASWAEVRTIARNKSFKVLHARKR